MDTNQVIDEIFGGTGKCAEFFNVLPSAVSNWRAAGGFPPRLHLRVMIEARARGHELPETFFATSTDAPTRAAV